MLKKINNNDAWEKIWNRNFFAKEFPDKEVVDFINYHLPKKNKRKKGFLILVLEMELTSNTFMTKGLDAMALKLLKKIFL